MKTPLRPLSSLALLAALSLSSPLLAVGAVGCSNESKAAGTASAAKTEGEKGSKGPVAAKFVKVRARKAPREVAVTGSLAGDESSEVATQAAGAVTSVLVDLGTRVKKGDVLVTLDRRDAELKLAQSQAALQQAVARLGLKGSEKFDAANTPDVRAAKEALDFAQLDADRNKSLLETGAITKAQYDPVRSRLESAKAQYDSSVAVASTSWAGVAAAQAAVSLSAKQLTDTSIRAPFDGSVAEKRITEGEYAAVGKIVCVVVQDDPLRLKIDLPETDLAAIAIGQKVEITVAAFPDKVFPGEIKRVGAALSATARTLPIEAQVDNHDHALHPGLFARARILVPGADGTSIFVPKSAIGTTGVTSRVYVKSGNHVVERLVTPGRADGDDVEVVGLKAGDEVATTEIDKLFDGAEITGE